MVETDRRRVGIATGAARELLVPPASTRARSIRGVASGFEGLGLEIVDLAVAPHGAHAPPPDVGAGASRTDRIRRTALWHELRWRRDARRSPSPAGLGLVYQRYDTGGAGMARVCRRAGVPLVVHVHATATQERDENELAALGLRGFERRWLERADLLWFVSDEVARSCDELSVSTPGIVIGNGVDADLLGGEPWAPGSSTIGFASSFRGFHSLDLLIDSFEHIAGEHPDVRFQLPGDGPERPAARARVETSPVLAGRVDFPGWLDRTSLRSMMEGWAATVVVTPRGTHRRNLKLLEAAAIGVPVVQVGDGGEPLDFTVRAAAAPDAIARAVGAVLDDPAGAARRSAAARRHAAANAWSEVVRRGLTPELLERLGL